VLDDVIIMALVLINIRMDEELKKSMENTYKSLGFNMTTAQKANVAF